MKLLKIKVYGEVQDVGYRIEAKRMADELGVRGFAQNQPDGSVYLEAEGDEHKLDIFLDWCRSGTPFSTVTKVEHEFSDKTKIFSEFKVI